MIFIKKEDLIKLEKRRKIYHFIQANPGIHLKEICKEFDMAKTTCIYHIRHLTIKEIITQKKDGKYNRFFINGSHGQQHKELFKLLRKKTCRDILFYILFMIGASQKEISDELEKHPAAISYYLKKLVEHELIEICLIKNGIVKRSTDNVGLIRTYKSREIVYRLTYNHKQMIYDFFLTYHKSLYTDSFIKTLIDWMEYLESEGLPKKMYSGDKVVDNAKDVYQKLFPLPFCA